MDDLDLEAVLTAKLSQAAEATSDMPSIETVLQRREQQRPVLALRMATLAFVAVALVGLGVVVTGRGPNSDIATGPAEPEQSNEATTSSPEQTSDTPPERDVSIEAEGSLVMVGPASTIGFLDLSDGTVETHDLSEAGLGFASILGLSTSAQSDLAITANNELYIYERDDLSSPSLVRTAPSVRDTPGISGELTVLPSQDEEHIWVMQPGTCCSDPNIPTLIDLVEIQSGEGSEVSSLQGAARIVGESTSGLIVSVEDAVETSDGWVSDETTATVFLVKRDGTVTELTTGRALVAHDSEVVMATASGLVLVNVETGNERVVVGDVEGLWTSTGGPVIPSTSPPLRYWADSEVLVAQIVDVDEETAVHAVSVDLETAVAERVVEMDSRAVSGITADGRWLISIAGDVVSVFDRSSDATSMTQLETRIPPDHFVLAIL